MCVGGVNSHLHIYRLSYIPDFGGAPIFSVGEARTLGEMVQSVIIFHEYDAIQNLRSSL